MNAKKIMGAVLVALLAAALFVGAGAADDQTKGAVIFVYQQSTGLEGTWTNGANTVTFVNGAITGTDIVEGVYSKGDDTITVKYPTATITATATEAGKTYNVIGGVYYQGDALTVNAYPANSTVGYVGYYVTLPNGVSEKVATADIGNYFNGKATGEYKIQAILDGTDFVADTPANFLVGKDVFSFTVLKDGDAIISAAADTIIESDVLTVTITGQPGVAYTLNFPGFTLESSGLVTPETSSDLANKKLDFIMSNTGKAVVYLKAGTNTGEFTLTLKATGADDVTVDVEILEGEITAETDKAAYFIGEDVTLSGTNTGKADLYFYIEGTNFPLAPIAGIVTSVESDGTWEQEFTYADFKGVYKKKLDAGTYTIYVSTANKAGAFKAADLKPYTTVSVNLKQPFLTAELKTSVVALGSDLVVTGTAESASEVMVYIFGTNKFVNLTQGVKSDSTYKIEFDVEAAGLDAGQYFVVIQHPMYNEVFNIAPLAEGIVLNITGDATVSGDVIIKEDERQTANAAEALCQALDTQNIDDIYVKATFIVAAPTATMNPVPSEVAKGTKLTVSGTTNLAPGEIITVEMLSTAFAAVPKESVNAASFIALTTKVQDDGTWEVTFDTTGLNLDEYTVQATVGEFITTAKVNVIEGAPVTPEQPDTPVTPEQPEQPEQPTEPETPGFGALAALAGLGAVAVLLLRRE